MTASPRALACISQVFLGFRDLTALPAAEDFAGRPLLGRVPCHPHDATEVTGSGGRPQALFPPHSLGRTRAVTRGQQRTGCDKQDGHPCGWGAPCRQLTARTPAGAGLCLWESSDPAPSPGGEERAPGVSLAMGAPLGRGLSRSGLGLFQVTWRWGRGRVVGDPRCLSRATRGFKLLFCYEPLPECLLSPACT